MESAENKIKKLVDEVRVQVSQAEGALEKALQSRDAILALPITKGELIEGFSYAVDKSSGKFEETLKSTICQRSRKRDAIGIERCPDTLRTPGKYRELNIDAINYFFGDSIKKSLGLFIDQMGYLDNGVDQIEYDKLLKTVELEIDELKSAKNTIVAELNSILK